jgi:hypothetical protein
MARPLEDQQLASTDFSGISRTHPISNYYEKIFSAVYGRHFDIEEDNTTITELLQECVGLIEVSEYLGCIHSVSNTINAALLGQGQVLFRSIAARPAAWVDLAVRARSATVFVEAIIHLVGKWNGLEASTKLMLDKQVRELCQKKHDELDEYKRWIECQILKFYPAHLGREIGAPPKVISRMSYSNDIMDWMALSVFRHWFASALALNRHRLAPDGGFWLYSQLASAGGAYLSKQELRSFHQKFPMSTRGENVLEEHVNGLKDEIKSIVAGLMRNESLLDTDRFPVEHLTCVKVEKAVAARIWEGRRRERLEWTEPMARPLAENFPVSKRGRTPPVTMREGPFQEDSSDYDSPAVKKLNYGYTDGSNNDGDDLGV